MKPMTYQDASYLKHSGEKIDIKITIKKIGNEPVIYIRDLEFNSFQRALEYLRYVAEAELQVKCEE